jgi:hypothetical protein
MAARVLFLMFVAALLSGCRQPHSEADLPGYVLAIPDDVPKHLVLIEKDGTQHEGDGRELYTRGHQAGWRQCWEEHQKGRLDARDESAVDGYIPQDYGIAVRGFVDGFKSCQRFLRQQ